MCLNCKENSMNLLQSACDIHPKTTEQRKARAGWDLIASDLMNFPPALLRITGVYKRTQLQSGCLPVTLVNFDLENTLETVMLGFVFITWNSWVSSNTWPEFQSQQQWGDAQPSLSSEVAGFYILSQGWWEWTVLWTDPGKRPHEGLCAVHGMKITDSTFYFSFLKLCWGTQI